MEDNIVWGIARADAERFDPDGHGGEWDIFADGYCYGAAALGGLIGMAEAIRARYKYRGTPSTSTYDWSTDFR